MPAAINWESSPSVTSYLTTELNSLANDGQVLGAAIDNSSGLDTFLDVEMVIATQGSARSAGAHIAVFLIPSIDGSNYTFGDASTQPPADKLIATMALDASVTARRIGAQMVMVPPGLWKLCIENKTGQALAATGNTVGYRVYSLESQ